MIDQLYEREDLDNWQALDRILDGRSAAADRAEQRRSVDASPLSAWLMARLLADRPGQRGPRRGR
ncbi:MAG: hypothetical protein ACREXW_01060 [Gammaproteobacteria bacterium]